MILMTEMEKEAHPILGGKGALTPKDQNNYQVARKEFSTLLGNLGKPKHGPQLLKEVYQLMDSLLSDYLKTNQLGCHPGCHWCCFQLVSCTTLEMTVIKQYLTSLPRPIRRPLLQRVKKAGLKFAKFYQGNFGDFSWKSFVKHWEDIAKPLKVAYFLKSCLYLNSRNLCDIYPVRPFDCRSTRTKDCCGPINKLTKEPKRLNLFVDAVVSDLITQEQQNEYGELKIVPLVTWPITTEFGDFFF